MKSPRERLQLIRKRYDLTLSDFCNKTGIPVGTMRGWEYSKHPLKEQTLERIIQAYRKVNIFVDKEWVIEGTGSPPKSLEEIKQERLEGPPPASTPMEEALSFKACADNREIFIIRDKSMEPLFPPNTIVGGELVSEEEYDDFNGKACLIQNTENNLFCRMLRKSSTEGSYHLIANNPSVENSVVADQKIIKLFKIVYFRRLD